MATKIVEDTKEALGLVYAPVGRFARGLRPWAAADAFAPPWTASVWASDRARCG